MTSSVRLAALALLLPSIASIALSENQELQLIIVKAVLVSVAGYFLTVGAIPTVKEWTQKAGLFGMDINKKGTKAGEKKIPESLGIVPGSVYLICVIFYQVFYITSPSRLVEYNAALASVCFMIFLGFADDVLDLRWRYKLVLPTLASLPLLCAYTGHTTIIVPKFIRELIGVDKLFDLGIIYYMYMGLFAVFCTNSINIFAGINGLEAGQSFVIACAGLLFSLLHLDGSEDPDLSSILLLIPFIATTLGLLYFNWYPSQVFVGDTFTYFAGMTFAVVAILGHNTEMMLLFFLPQIINFVYSLPQLFGIVPCPRHRLPKLNMNTGKLEGIKSNMNLVNLALLILGPQTEQTLCVILLVFQTLCCALAFWVHAMFAQIQ